MKTPGAVRVAGLSYQYWRQYKVASMFGLLLTPTLYLLAMGIGVGGLVDERQGTSTALGGLSYLAFIGPGLMVTTALMAAATETTWPVVGGMRWERSYHAMAATALAPGQIAGGVGVWTVVRSMAAAIAVAVPLGFFDDTRTLGLIPAVVVSALTGLAVGMPIAAWSATRERDVSLPVIHRFAIFPMFLLSGAFFPIDQLPVAAQALAWVVPSFHGIELARGLTAGGLGAEAALHVGVLLAYIAVGIAASRLTFTRALHL